MPTQRVRYYWKTVGETMLGVGIALSLVLILYAEASLQVTFAAFMWTLRVGSLVAGVLYGVVIRPVKMPIALWYVALGAYYVFAQNGSWLSRAAITHGLLSLALAHTGWLVMWSTNRLRRRG